ncbi:hypothetical protein THAOC_11889, partial [Thalassiosira oceanica]
MPKVPKKVCQMVGTEHGIMLRALAGGASLVRSTRAQRAPHLLKHASGPRQQAGHGTRVRLAKVNDVATFHSDVATFHSDVATFHSDVATFVARVRPAASAVDFISAVVLCTPWRLQQDPKEELADPTAQPSSKRSKTSGSHPKQKQAQSVDFREVFIQKLTTPEVSHLFEASADPRIAECNVFSKTKYRIRAGTLVTCMPIVGGKVGHSIDLNAMAIVTEVDAGKGRVVLCNRMELYDDNHVGENALEALGCNRKVMLYALDKDGVLQHASNKEFVEFDRLYLETSKLKDGTYKSVDAIINHIFAKRKFDANM